MSDGSVVNALIYDTGGQEKFKSINKSYYNKANAILLVYDISNHLSFDEIKDYYCNEIKEICGDNIPVILLGNKTDLEGKRQVKQEEGVILDVSHNYKFKETSALKNENVADAFEALIELWNVEYNNEQSTIKRVGSGDLPTKENNLPRRNSMFSQRKNPLDSENESKTFKLSKKILGKIRGKIPHRNICC